MFLLLPLLALKCEKDDIVKANRFEITVRVTGTHLDGLGAEMHVSSVLNVLNPTTGPTLTYSYGSSVSQTYTLGTFGIQDQFTAVVAFRNVTCNSSLQPATDSRLRLEVLANGVLVNVVELAPGSRSGSFSCSPYWINTTVGNGDDWD
ncbi:hypothetical protein GCM10023185_45060 [Hymenobacter saemangeumensis]|uniref:Uncharacterized protein n=1 Tax=Hymenobacter saemangeumensis TaxID=1084522 RepID=A0ABP8IT56_9BACT